MGTFKFSEASTPTKIHDLRWSLKNTPWALQVKQGLEKAQIETGESLDRIFLSQKINRWIVE